MADYSELKRKAQEIRDEVKAGANTASRVGIAIEETINALEAESVRAVAKEGSLQNDIQSINERIQDLGDIREGVGELQEDVTEQGKDLDNLMTILEGKLDIKDLGSGLRPDQAVSEIINYVRTNNIKSALVFKYIDTDNSSTFGICISRIGVSGWILYLVARKGIEVLKYNSYGSRETWNEYGGVLRHSLNSVADEQLECLSIKGLKSVLITKQDELAPGDGITLAGNTVSTLIGDGLAYNGREMVVSHDATLKTTKGKLGVNTGHGLFFTPDNNLGVRTGKGLTINHDDGTVEVAKEVFDEIGAKAPLDGYAPKLKVKYSEELVGRDGQTEEARIGELRATGGAQLSIGDGNATVVKVKGKSVVWNQFVNYAKISTGAFGLTIKGTEDGQIHLSGTYTNTKAGEIRLSRTNIIIPNGHKVIIPSEKKDGVMFRLQGGNSYNTITTSNGNMYYDPVIHVDCTEGQEVDMYIRFSLHNLTLMFGAGNEPATIEEFEARKPLGVTNEYNEGKIISFDGDAVKSVGFNAWDEEWEVGGFYGGNKLTQENYNNTIRSKNYIPVIPKAVYKFTTPLTLYINYFDVNKKYLSAITVYPSTTSFTIPENAHYMWHRSFDNTYGSTYKNDICLHLVHSGYRDGEYEPYVDDIHSLPDIKNIKDNNGNILFPYGLCSAGNVYDEITTTKAIKRVGVVDMGTLTWLDRDVATPDNTSSYKIMLAPSQTNNMGQALKAVALNAKYIWLETKALNVRELPDKTYMFSNGDIYLRDNDYTILNDIKAAMQGVLLYYELATPIEVDLQEPLNMTYEAWDFGTEELIADTPTTPMDADIAYMFNAVDRIRENSKHTMEAEGRLAELERMVTELQTQLTNLTTGNE